MKKKPAASAAGDAKILDARYRLGGVECLQIETLPVGFEWGTPKNPDYDQYSHVYPVGHDRSVVANGEEWHEYKALCECYTTLSRPENKPNMDFSATLRLPTDKRKSLPCEECLAALCQYDGQTKEQV